MLTLCFINSAVHLVVHDVKSLRVWGFTLSAVFGADSLVCWSVGADLLLMLFVGSVE